MQLLSCPSEDLVEDRLPKPCFGAQSFDDVLKPIPSEVAEAGGRILSLVDDRERVDKHARCDILQLGCTVAHTADVA